MADLVCGTSTGSEIADAINDNTNGKAPVGHRHDGTEVDVSVEGTSYVLNDALELFVLEEAGKGLSDNNFTDDYQGQIIVNKTDITELQDQIAGLTNADAVIDSTTSIALPVGSEVPLTFEIATDSTDPSVFSIDDAANQITMSVVGTYSYSTSAIFTSIVDVNALITTRQLDISNDAEVSSTLVPVSLLAGQSITVPISNLVVLAEGEAPVTVKGVISSDVADVTLTAYSTTINSSGAAVLSGVGKYVDSNLIIDKDAAGGAFVTGADNILLGNSAGEQLTTGATNIAIGPEALRYGTEGMDNIAIGSLAGQGESGTGVTGDKNTLLGVSAGSTISTGSNNLFLGASAGAVKDSFVTGSDNIALGYTAGTGLTTGYENIFIGKSTGKGVSDPFRIYTSGNNNIGMGINALNYLATGNNNVALGKSAGEQLSSGNDNVYIGAKAGKGYALGTEELIGDGNVALGASAGTQLKNGSLNVLLGYSAGSDLIDESNQLRIANKSSEALIEGDFSLRTLKINASLEADSIIFTDLTVPGDLEVLGTISGTIINLTTKITAPVIESTNVTIDTINNVVKIVTPLVEADAITIGGEAVHANPKTWTIQDGDAEPSTGLTDGDILYVWTN